MTGRVETTALVSIIMSVYNGADYVRECMESLLGQTWRELEIVVVDDASTDATAEILQELATQNGRVRFLRNTTNCGLSASLNTALAQASGEYIARMDADDVSVANRIELQMQYLLANPKVEVVGTNYESFTESSRESWPGKIHHGGIRGGGPPLVHGTILARKSLFDRLGGYNVKYTVTEDHDLMLRWYVAGVEMHNLHDVLYRRRLHNSNVSNSQKRRQIAQNLVLNFRALFRHRIFFNAAGWKHLFVFSAYWMYLAVRLNRIVSDHTIKRLLGRPQHTGGSLR